MRTGDNGRIAVYWSQTELDGLEAAPLAQLAIGAAWSWRGSAIDIMSESALGLKSTGSHETDVYLASGSSAQNVAQAFSVYATLEFSNGAQGFAADLVWAGGDDRLMLIFENGCPARDQEFWISAITLAAKSAGHAQADNTVVAFPTPTVAPKATPLRLVQLAGVAAE